jgi:hypothetical protein
MMTDLFILQLTVIFVYALKIPNTGYCRLIYAIVCILIKLDKTKKIVRKERRRKWNVDARRHGLSVPDFYIYE